MVRTDTIDSVAYSLKQKVERTKLTTPMSTRKYISLMMCELALKVADAMSSDEALLLPSVYRDFVHPVRKQWTLYFEGEQTVPDSEIPGIRWLLAQLHFFLEIYSK